MRTNQEAAKIIADANLSLAQVAQYLNTSTDDVRRWLPDEGKNPIEEMPASDLQFLKYCLMADNTRTHLF